MSWKKAVDRVKKLLEEQTELESNEAMSVTVHSETLPPINHLGGI